MCHQPLICARLEIGRSTAGHGLEGFGFISAMIEWGHCSVYQPLDHHSSVGLMYFIKNQGRSWTDHDIIKTRPLTAICSSIP